MWEVVCFFLHSILLNTLWALLLALSSLDMACFSLDAPDMGRIMAKTTLLATTTKTGVVCFHEVKGKSDSIRNKTPQ